jgi:hypothetical protein
MTNARESLATLLFNTSLATSLSAHVTEESLWPEIFRLAELWSVVPQLSERIQTLRLAPPPDLWQPFKRLHIATYARTASRAARGLAALQQLQDAHIPAIAFKGLASMARLYDPPASRTIKDADILIAPSTLHSALSALSAIGYLPEDGLDPARLENFLDHSPGFSGNKAIVLSDSTGFELDLHWSIGLREPTFPALLNRSEASHLFNAPLRIVGLADSLLLTSRHAIRENLSIDTMCRDLLDILSACHLIAANPTLTPPFDASANITIIAGLAKILMRLNPADVAANRMLIHFHERSSPKRERDAQNLCDLFFDQLTLGPISKDLTYLSHTRPLRQIAAGALANWREYRGFMRSMEEKLDGQQRPLGRRFLDLTDSWKKTGHGSLRRLRTLARHKYGSGG